MKFSTGIFKVTIIFSILVFMTCCHFSDNSIHDNSFTIATWNVQNLFDADDNGTEYAEFRNSSGWNTIAYKKKLENVKTVLSYLDADTIVLNEIENENVLNDLNTLVPEYKYYTCAGQKEGAVKTAIISKIPIESVRTHNVENLRPILEATLQSPIGPVRLFAIHAKSKTEGIEATKNMRLQTGNVLASIVKPDSIQPIIIAGDFNEEISEGNIFCDIRYGLTDAPLKVSPSPVAYAWYNPFLDSSQTFVTPGTYCYNGQWEKLDNILTNFTDCWEISEAQIVYKGILKTAQGTPNAFNRTLLTGVSDHLPVTLKFKYTKGDNHAF